jgi:hypothetical protein
MFRIISISRGIGAIVFFVDDKTNYSKRIIRYDTGEMEIEHKYPVINYANYIIFAAIMGKFDPYTRFLEKPVEVPDLELSTLDKLYDELAEKFNWAAEDEAELNEN